MKTPSNYLIVADSDHDADMLYAVGMFVPDPFIHLCLSGRRYLIMSDLEIDRAKVAAPHCRVLSMSERQAKLRKAGVKNPGFADVIADFLHEKKVRSLSVPSRFPLALAHQLKKKRITLTPVDRAAFFAERELKAAIEVKKISAALMMAEVGMAEAMQVLRASKIARDRRLIFQSTPLTSEKLQAVIGCAILKASGLAANTIVAGGRQACDPHERGSGLLRANEPIIIDIFPRSQKTGYFGDITRTVVRGRATEAARKLYHTVHQGQSIAFKKIRDGVPTADVHAAVMKHFEEQGYKTRQRNGRWEGFFHGTGHGLGLEIHEAPRMGATSLGKLKAGQVVTNEPGLYYPEIGGVRLEDVALVQNGPARNLTRFEKVFEI